MRAREMMTAAVVSVAPDTTTREAARILRDRGISAVPVVDDSGKPIGMLSEGWPKPGLVRSGRQGPDRHSEGAIGRAAPR